jgi:ABC-2 type transport system permease protein
MSAAEAVPSPAAGALASPVRATSAPRRRVSTRFLRSELWLIFGRRRNWAGLVMLAAVPVIVAIAVKIDPPRGGGGRGDGPDFFTSITSNGLFVALAALTLELPLFLPVAVAAISADSVAGEANLGTLRYLLAVPVQRTRMLAVKFTALVIFTFAATTLVAAVGAGLGLVLFGGGEVTLLSGTQVPFASGVLRLLLVVAYLAACLCALSAVGLFVSTLTEQPVGATIAIVIFSIVSFILDSIPQLDWLHPYLLTHSWTAFGDLLREPIATNGVQHGLVSAGIYVAVFWAAAWARFAGKDVSS